MGTNYYHRSNICECCGRFDEQHICKSMTMFNGVVRWLDEKPYGFVVTVPSWQDWKARLVAGGEVWDEYGERWDTDQFIERVEVTDADDRGSQHAWIVRNRPELASDGPEDSRDWLDADGFSFHGGEFS